MKEGVPQRILKGKHETGNESLEEPELFRASLGFDFIFHTDSEGVKHCYCIEINGDDSGISGMQNLPDGHLSKTRKIITAIRDRRSLARAEQVNKAIEIYDDIDSGVFSVSEEARKIITRYMSRSILKKKLLPHAFSNPIFLSEITDNKLEQQKYIPESSKPRMYTPQGDSNSSTGFWICKPKRGRGGKDIGIVSNQEFNATTKHLEVLQNDYLVQEFISADGALKAPAEKRDNPAAMRLLVDFRYMENGEIETVFEAGYQRVSPLPSDAPTGNMERIHVVNKKRGASAEPAADDEISLARPIAHEIIQNIAKAHVQTLKQKNNEKTSL